MTSPAVIQAMIARGQAAMPRIGVVTDVFEGPPMSVRVRFVEGGTPFAPSIVAQSINVQIGDKCLVVPTGTQWVFIGIITDPDPDHSYQVMEVDLKNNWRKIYDTEDLAWRWQYDTIHHPTHPTAEVSQGRWPFQGGGQGGVTQMPMEDYATVMNHNLYNALDAIAGLGGTVSMVELEATRGDGQTPTYASPKLYGHLYDENNPPVLDQPPAWVSGYGPLSLAPFAKGQRVRWVLPASWVAAVAAGTIRGFGFESHSTDDRFMSYADQTGTFTGGLFNAKLIVTLTAPVKME